MSDEPGAHGSAGAGMTTGRKAGLMAGVAGLSAVGTAAGVSAARALRHRKAIRDAYEGEDFALLEADRGCVITTPTGYRWWCARSARSPRR